MIITSEKTLNIKIEMSERDAEILMALVQNAQYEGEPEEINAFREELFHGLKEKLK